MSSDDLYFSERQKGEPPREQETLNQAFWGGFVAIIRARLADGSLAEDFPINCFEAPYPTECDIQAVGLAFCAENPSIPWPLDPNQLPETLDALDALEFFARYMSKPDARSHHSYGRHDHIHSFDRAAGRSEYFAAINRLFRRCRHPYQLELEGSIRRVGSPIIQDILSTIRFETGDSELDRLLSVAQQKFQEPDPTIRTEGLEKLWDAWERLKTILPGDKKASVTQLLDQAVTEPTFRTRVEEEAIALTKIGNDFMIRHTETGKPKIERYEHVDYLFHRLFALVWMILRIRGAVGT